MASSCLHSTAAYVWPAVLSAGWQHLVQMPEQLPTWRSQRVVRLIACQNRRVVQHGLSNGHFRLTSQNMKSLSHITEDRGEGPGSCCVVCKRSASRAPRWASLPARLQQSRACGCGVAHHCLSTKQERVGRQVRRSFTRLTGALRSLARLCVQKLAADGSKHCAILRDTRCTKATGPGGVMRR